LGYALLRPVRLARGKVWRLFVDVGRSVTKAIDEIEGGDLESAMLHACNAIDGTAAKALPAEGGSNKRFTNFLRSNYLILGAMGMPGINLKETRFPVAVAKPKAPDGRPDLADVLYGIHRCTHGHGSEMPKGFELRPDFGSGCNDTSLHIEKGRIQFSDRILFGLLAVAVMAPENTGQLTPGGYHLTLVGEKYEINDWWGKRAEFETACAPLNRVQVKLDFGHWMT
jgi:hypothetical protein